MKTRNFVKHFILTIFLSIAFLSNTMTQTAIEPIGEGTDSNPYQISSIENLYWVSQNPNSWDSFFIQTEDIGASETRQWENPWEPIGNNSSPFTGSYNGQGHIISNLFINMPGQDYVGLFGLISHGAEIYKLGLKNIEVIGDTHVGGLTGRIAGVGNSTTSVREVFVTGKITADSKIGGISGEIGNNMEILNSYVNVTIYALDPWWVEVGGITGKVAGNSNITNSFAIAEIFEANQAFGGLTGNGNANNVSNSFYNSDLVATSSNGTGKTTEELMQLNTFDSSWDIANVCFNEINENHIWNIIDGYTYPFLSWENAKTESPNVYTSYVTEINSLFARLVGKIENFSFYAAADVYFKYRREGTETWSQTPAETITEDKEFYYVIINLSPETDYEFKAAAEYGENSVVFGELIKFKTPEHTESDGPLGLGTEKNPYQISHSDDLLWISENPNSWSKHFMQIADINMSLTQEINDGKGWSPIGNDGTKFTGSFNGQHYIIDNLFINRPDEDYIGLFGYADDGAVIKNLSLENVDITGGERTGAIAGKIKGEWDRHSEISISYAKGYVVGKEHTGGLVGVSAYRSIIINSYSIVDVSGDFGTGGVVGAHWSDGVVINSYSASIVDAGPWHNPGGVVGHRPNTENSFYDSDVFNNGERSSQAKSTEEMKNQQTFIEAGWDFDNIWTIDPDGEINEGYPFFQKNKESNESQLPITLKHFNAFAENNEVRIEWTTASEINNDYFSIQRSSDAINFETIEVIEGAGFSNTDISYFTYDESPLQGVSYYRLKQTDYDGTYEIFHPVAVMFEAELDEPELHVFPNPAPGNDFQIQITTEAIDNTNVQIYSTDGIVVFSKNFENANYINIQGNEISGQLNPGIYFVVVNNGDSKISERLLIL